MTLPHAVGGPVVELLGCLFRASLSATFIVALIVLVQAFFGRWLTPAWRYRLWAVMIVRLLLPALPSSRASLGNFEVSSQVRRVVSVLRNDDTAERPPQKAGAGPVDPLMGHRPKVTVIYETPRTALRPRASQPTKALAPLTRPQIRLPSVLALLWFAGVVLLFARLIAANLRLAHRLRTAVRVTDAVLLKRLNDCCRRAGIGGSPELLITDAVRIPAAAGLWRPRLLVPPGLFDELDDPQQRSVLLHELAHVRCRDVLANWVLAVAQIIHWFNPFIAWAIGRLKLDREMARDAMVLRWIAGGGDAAAGREQYARTLLNLAESLCVGRRCLGTTAGLAGICMPARLFTAGGFGRGSGLKRRLQMIKTSGRRAVRSTLLGSLIAAALVCGTLTRAQDPPAPATRPQAPSAAERKIADSNEDMLAGEVRALITSHKYEEALTVLKEIHAADPKSQFVAEVRPTALRQLRIQERLAKSSRDDVQKRLDQVLPEVSFDGVGFSDVIDFLRDVSGANIFVNWKSLDASKVARNTPVTLRLKGVPFSKVLDIVLDSAGGGRQKLAYVIDEGVLTISTADDLAKNVQVRVYDVRDLLSVPPDFVPARLGTPEPADASGPATAPSNRIGDRGLREQAVKLLVQTIEASVAPDSWKDRGGGVAALRELQGQLIVTQTPDNQIQIMRLLQQMRESRGVQCTVESRFISCDEPVARALIAKWQKIATPATLPAGGTAQPGNSGTVGMFLDEDQIAQFLKAGDNDQRLSDIGAPRITLFNGQRAYVQISTSHRYTSGYAAVTVPGGQIRYDPVASVVETGLLLDVQATVGSDGKSVALSLHPQISELVGMKQGPWIGRPTGSNLAIQEPQIRSTELRTTVDVPTDRTLLIGGLEDPRVDDSAAETRPNRPLRSLFLLVKPRPIFGTAASMKSSPLKTSQLRATQRP